MSAETRQKACISCTFLHLFSACMSKKRCTMGRRIDLVCHFFPAALKRLALGLCLPKLVRWYEANLLVFYKLFLLKHLMRTLTKWQHTKDQKQPWLEQFWQSQMILSLWTMPGQKKQRRFPRGVWLCQYRSSRSEDGSCESQQETRYHSLIIVYHRRYMTTVQHFNFSDRCFFTLLYLGVRKLS